MPVYEESWRSQSKIIILGFSVSQQPLQEADGQMKGSTEESLMKGLHVF